MWRLRALAASTAFRWCLAIAGGFTAMTLALFVFIYWETAVHERARIDHLVMFEAQYAAGGRADEVAPRLATWLAEDLHGVRYGGLFDPAGRLLTGNLLTPPSGLPEDGVPHQAVFGPIDRDLDSDVPEAVRGVARRLADGRLLVIGYDIDELEQVRDLILRGLGLGLVPAVTLALLAGMMLAERGQRRIAAFHRALDRIMLGQLGERLPVRESADEFDRMALAVNQMLNEIERLVGDIRNVGNNIAHDLRTPLTRVRTRLERSRDEARTVEEFRVAVDRSIASVDQALAVITAVLRIGEIEHGRRRAAFAPVDLCSVLRDVAELYDPLAEEKEVALQLSLAPVRPVLGDHDLLVEALGNLLDNAIKFTPPGTAVHISVAEDTRGARLRIRDQGPGIPAAERMRVAQRFYRSEESRTVDGSGLGLSLVAAILALHGFRMEISGAGPGCMVEIACPANTTPA